MEDPYEVSLEGANNHGTSRGGIDTTQAAPVRRLTGDGNRWPATAVEDDLAGRGAQGERDSQESAFHSGSGAARLAPQGRDLGQARDE